MTAEMPQNIIIISTTERRRAVRGNGSAVPSRYSDPMFLSDRVRVYPLVLLCAGMAVPSPAATDLYERIHNKYNHACT